MSNFVSVTQNVFQATPGQSLSNIVKFTIYTSPLLSGVFVFLRDIATGVAVCANAYGFTYLGGNITDFLPGGANSNVASLAMPNNPWYLQVEVVEVGLGGSFNLADKRVLQPIVFPGTQPPPGIPPDQLPVAVALGGITVASIAGLAYNRYRRGKRRR